MGSWCRGAGGDRNVGGPTWGEEGTGTWRACTGGRREQEGGGGALATEGQVAGVQGEGAGREEDPGQGLRLPQGCGAVSRPCGGCAGGGGGWGAAGLGFAAARVPDDEHRVPHLEELLELYDLEHEAVFRLQLELDDALLDDLGRRAQGGVLGAGTRRSWREGDFLPGRGYCEGGPRRGCVRSLARPTGDSPSTPAGDRPARSPLWSPGRPGPPH